MTSPLTQAGVDKLKPQRYAPLTTNRYFTGLWTQRNPLRDAATTYLYEKFYSGSRFESLIDGSNIEVSNRLTLIRRPGSTVYNNQTFPAIKRFYPFSINTGSSSIIKVMADTATDVFDATGPSTKTSIFTKSAGAGQTYFQSVGNTLYFSDGIDATQWKQPSKQYVANTTYTAGNFGTGDTIIDSNGNLQLAFQRKINSLATSVTIGNPTADQCALAFNTGFSGQDLNIPAGTLLQFTNFVGASFLNFGTEVVEYAINQLSGFGLILGTLQNLSHAGYGPSADTGLAWVNIGTGVSGGSAPTWQTAQGFVTLDNTVLWVCLGPSVFPWGIAAPANAPSVANIANNTFPTWTANTYYNPSLLILDTNGNYQKLTTGGTTGGAQPVWNVTTGGTTADNTAVWTNQGTSVRATSHAYTIGALIVVTFSVIKTVKMRDPETGEIIYTEITLGPYTDSFKCVTAGTSSASTTATLPWSSGIGSQVQDGTVVWQNAGKSITWPSIGAAALVSLVTQIDDSNGNLQNIINPGKSGAMAPPWATTLGTGTLDNTATWQNAGPGTAANTGSWVYGYSFRNQKTGHVSSSSPKSTPITLAASSLISVSGQGSTDPNVDIIRIWRTVQGGSVLLFLADITAPANGGVWSYVDASPDPPNPASTINPLITADVTGVNTPPPVGLINLAYHLNRVWGSVGTTVYYSAAAGATSSGNAFESWAPLNNFVFPSSVTRLVPITQGLIVFTTSSSWIIQGDGAPTLFASPFLQGQICGISSYNAIDVNGSLIHLYTTNRELLTLDPNSGVSEDGFPIGDKLAANYDPTAVYVAWHNKNSTDSALYIADGATQWYRLNRTPAPETGMTWSPKGTIAAGFSAVQSVEVSPGIHELLFGPSSSGPILKRDTSVNADNGATYTAFATVGSIVLANPGQVALVDFIATDALQIGSRPAISVLLDEVSGTFESLTLGPPDPPDLLPSVTTFNDRWYMSTTQEPAVCRHMQLKLSWIAENFANELLTHTINGTVE